MSDLFVKVLWVIFIYVCFNLPLYVWNLAIWNLKKYQNEGWKNTRIVVRDGNTKKKKHVKELN